MIDISRLLISRLAVVGLKKIECSRFIVESSLWSVISEITYILVQLFLQKLVVHKVREVRTKRM